MFIDLFSLEGDRGEELIMNVRDRHREIGIALYGTSRELWELPGVEGIARDTLQHYWRLPKDSNDESFRVTVEDMILFLFIYRLSGGRFGERPGSVALAMMRPEVAGAWEIWRRIQES
jgi:hypothetical protein